MNTKVYPKSQVRVTAMLLLINLGYQKLRISQLLKSQRSHQVVGKLLLTLEVEKRGYTESMTILQACILLERQEGTRGKYEC